MSILNNIIEKMSIPDPNDSNIMVDKICEECHGPIKLGEWKAAEICAGCYWILHEDIEEGED